MSKVTKLPIFNSLFSTKLGRFSIVVGVHLIALFVSWWNLVRIYPHEPVPFLESVAVSLFLGFTALPLSAGHLLIGLGDEGIISVGGRPGLFVLELLISLLVFCAFLYFIFKGKKYSDL